MRNVRERPAALLSYRGVASDDLPRVHLTGSKNRRIGRGGNNICNIIFTVVCSIVLLYSLYCLVTGQSVLEFLKHDSSKVNKPDPSAYRPDWRPRMEALRPLLIGGGSDTVAGLKTEALMQCSTAESSCEDVIEPFEINSPGDEGVLTSKMKEQKRARRRCGIYMHLCELSTAKVKDAIVEEGGEDALRVAPAPFVSACSDQCWERGTCNEELKRCDCLGDYAGQECEVFSLPACHLSPLYKTPCVDGGASCQCLLQCEKFGLINMGLESAQTGHVCLEDRGFKEGYGVTKAEWLFKQPLMHMNTFGNGTEQGNREEEVDSRIDVLEPTVPSECENGCSGKGVCHTGGDMCWCSGVHSGKFCEGQRPSRPFGCLNKCSGQGKCVDGMCHCYKGFFGIDCSIYPAGEGKFELLLRKPFPLDYLALDNAPPAPKNAEPEEIKPLIYVYELPVNMVAWLFQHRQAGDYNTTGFKYAEALVFYEALLASEHRTANAVEADFFFVPLLVSLHGQRNIRLTKAVEYISTNWPYWTKHHGADHIFFNSEEWGNCNLEPLGWRANEFKNVIGLTPWTYQRNMFGGKVDPCFIREQDIGVPLAYGSAVMDVSPHVQGDGNERRDTLVFWCEDSNQPYMAHRPNEGFVGLAEHYREPAGVLRKYRTSFGLRQKILDLHGQNPGDWTDGAKIQRVWPGEKLDEMARSVFCLAPPGWGVSNEWSTLSVLMGCIPVFFKTNESYAFGYEVVNWDDISVSIDGDEIEALVDILRAIPKPEVERKQAAMKDVWPYFVWSSAQWDPLETLPKAARALHVPKIMKKGPFATIMRILRNRLSGKGTDDEDLPAVEEDEIPQQEQADAIPNARATSSEDDPIGSGDAVDAAENVEAGATSQTLGHGGETDAVDAEGGEGGEARKL